MTDLHTHILPQIDDGAQSAEESIVMLRAQWAQGVRTAALTPHFYPEQQSAQAFLAQRKAAFDLLTDAIAALDEAERAEIPSLILGAEVAWTGGLAEMAELPELCYEGTRCLLVELPFCPWREGLFRELNDLMNRTGLTPVIAHIDRYFAIESAAQLERLYSFGLPVQLSAAAFNGYFSRRRAIRLLTSGKAQLLVSDCHDPTRRAPNLAKAYTQIEKRCDPALAEDLSAFGDRFLNEY